jgi:2-polyprenyl-3-methyl-5-hydroxy-6-metoxy-1,4-benzoquinol methylase
MDRGSSINVKCDLCGHDEPELFLEKDGFKIVRCKNCSLVYVNPRFSQDTLCDMYNDNIISPFQYYLDTKREDERTFNERLDFIEEYTIVGKLLDVGCSIGTFSNVAQKRGWDIAGVDINRMSANYCIDNLGFDVKVGNFQEVDLPKEYFDLVLMNDFLEHVPSPTNALSKANELVKKGGYLFVVTPKIDSIMAKLSKERWLHLKPDEHLYYFSTKTMEKLLNKTGFELISQRSIGRYRNLNTIFFKATTYGDSIYRITRALVNNRFGRNMTLMLNLRDEMAVLARKV